MSYDINFWKPRENIAQREPQAIYEDLCSGNEPPELEQLPIDEIQRALVDRFPSYKPDDEFPLIELDEGSIEVSISDRSVRFDFRGGDTGDEKLATWNLLHGRFGCVCYDPQDGTLHTADNPPDFRDLTPEQRAEMEKLFGGLDMNSMVRHLQQRQRRARMLGCAVLLALGLLMISFVAGIIWLIVWLVRG